MADLIDRRMAYIFLTEYYNHRTEAQHKNLKEALSRVPEAQPDRLTDDDLETIRIHLSAYKGLCNQHRWKEAEEYQRIIDRFMSFASAQPETCEGCRHLGKWENEIEYGYSSPCTRCKRRVEDHYER